MKCMHCQGEMKKGDAPLHIDCKGCHVHSVKRSQESRGIDWLAENRNALKGYNRRIELKGVFSEGLRRF